MTAKILRPLPGKRAKTGPKKKIRGKSRWSRRYDDEHFRERIIPPGFLNSSRIMALTGITHSQFKSLTARGRLRPGRYSYLGEALYPYELVSAAVKEYGATLPLDELPKIEPLHKIEDERAVLQGCLEGKTCGRIAVESGIPMHTVEAIAATYRRLEGDFIIPAAVMVQIGMLSLPGTFPFPDPDELLLVLKELVGRGVCQCGGDASYCGGCARRKYAPEAPARDAKPA